LVATLGVTGCGDDPVKAGVAKGCTLNSDCNGGLVCSFGLCHQECEVTTDCPAGQRCVQTDDSNVCQLADEAQCHFKSDCQDPLVCAIDLQCRNECKKDEDCLKGQQCADGVCAEPAEVTEEGGLKGAVGAGGEGGGSGTEPVGGSSSGGTAGTGAMSSAGGEGGATTVETCVPGGDCVPTDQPCQVGTIACQDGQEVCEVAGDADDGTDCGKNKVCDAGACVACKAGDSCQPDANNTCVAGVVTCALGPACEVSGNVQAGTSCGTDKVCSAGSCVACKADEACDPPGQACKNGKLSCAAGPVCQATDNKPGGFACDTDKVCDSSANCVACVQDAACKPGNDCHQGTQDCTTGPNCVDTQLAASDGLSCTGNAAYNFCTGGVCLACQNGNTCVPANPCHKGTLNCATTPPTCNDTQANAADGLTCGANQSCISGTCLTNDRTLTITSGAVADVAIDAPFTPVSVHLVDGNNQPVQGASVTVVPSAGAYAVASAGTNASGNAQITGRAGRAVGTYKFTVSAPGATSIEFSVNAVAPNAKDIFTLVNVNHLSGVSTVPGPGTISKLYYQARAVTSANDGTLYIASYCAVFKLTPAGVLTRIAGDAAESCGFTGDTGLATSARGYNVSGLALDETNGYLYLADYSNYRVRQIDLASGNILTLAGTGSGGSNVAPYGDGGPADSAYLLPSNVAVAPNGDVYISDANSNRIRKVDAITGVITTVITNTSCSAANPLSLYYCGASGDACSMAWDTTGKLFISGYLCGNGMSSFRGVARVEADKSLTLVAGTTGAANPAEGGTATSAAFTNSPYITFDKAGNLFMATTGDHRVRRVDAVTTKITTVAGTGTANYSGDYVLGSTAEVSSPTTIAFDGAGNLYFADFNNYAIRSVYGIGSTTVPTGKLATVTGTGQTVKRDAPFTALAVKLTDGSNAAISGVGIDWKRLETGSGLGSSGATAVATKTNASGNAAMTGRVGLASGDYTFTASYTDIHGTPVSGSPQTFTVKAEDPDAGTIFPVVNYVHTSGLGGTPGPATFGKLQSYALGVAAASDGTIYASDQCAVYQITPRGEMSVFAGTPGSCSFAGDSGPAAGAKLYYPEGMALDETNQVLYIADNGNRRVRRVSLTTGVITTLAGGGSVTTAPYGDGGDATSANIGAVQSVTVGPDGKVYIPDPDHYGIRVVDEYGTITTWVTPSYGNGNCVNGTVSFYYASADTTVRFTSNGGAYISGYICQGTTTNNTLGIVLRASNGTFTRVAGLYNGIQTENADATATTLPDISDFIIDGNGDLVLALYGNHKLRRITLTDGKINTIAGDGTAGYFQPGDVTSEPGAYVPATGVRVYNPYKLALWPGGHVMFSDEYTYTTRMIW
jgi:sugar lactone lactonase YvrE